MRRTGDPQARALSHAAVAGALVDLAGPDGAVFMVWNPAYRTYEDVCEGVVESLGATYPAVTEVEVAEPEDNFEHATVTWFRR